MKQLLTACLVLINSIMWAQPEEWDHNLLAKTLNTEKNWSVKVTPEGDYESLVLSVKPTGKKDMDGNSVHQLVFSDKDGNQKLTLEPDFTKKTGAFVDYHGVDPRIFIIVSPELLARVHRPDEDAYYEFIEGSFFTSKGERKKDDMIAEFQKKTAIKDNRNTRNVVDIQKRIADYMEEEFTRESQHSEKEKAKKFKAGIYHFYQFFGTKGVTSTGKYKISVQWLKDDDGNPRLSGISMIKAGRDGEFGATAESITLEYDSDKDYFVDPKNPDEKWVIYHGRLMRASKYNMMEGVMVHEEESLGDDYFVLYEKTYGFMKPTKTRYREDVGESHYKGEKDKAYFNYWFSRYVIGG